MHFDDTLGEAAFRAEVSAWLGDSRVRGKMAEMLEQFVRRAPHGVRERIARGDQ